MYITSIQNKIETQISLYTVIPELNPVGNIKQPSVYTEHYIFSPLEIILIYTRYTHFVPTRQSVLRALRDYENMFFFLNQ